MLLGAGGFIGRHVVAWLARDGHRVVAVVRRTDGLAPVFPDIEVCELDLAGERGAARAGLCVGLVVG